MQKSTQMEILCRLESLHREGRDQQMLGRMVQLPVQIYTDANILAEEMKSVFRHHPMLVGHASSVRDPGSYLLSDWSSFPYVIVRNTDGRLRAFLNTCRHRGARLVSGKEPCLKAFVCPFHGWTYGLDGRLKGVTKSYNFPEMDRDDFGLVELAVAERAGLIWIHPTPGEKIDLEKDLGPIGDDLDHFGLEGLVSYRKNSVIKHANWKLLIKTYQEGYHVPLSAPGHAVARVQKGRHCALRTRPSHTALRSAHQFPGHAPDPVAGPEHPGLRLGVLLHFPAGLFHHASGLCVHQHVLPADP